MQGEKLFSEHKAHNTVMINDTDQSQCWGTFRLAKRAHVRVLSITSHSITMKMTDQKGQTAERKIDFHNGKLRIVDRSPNAELTSFLHFEKELLGELKEGGTTVKSGNTRWGKQLYSPEFGIKKAVSVLEISGKDQIDVEIELEKLYASVV